MTREEAIEILYQYSVRDMTYPKEDIEAFELAIKALEQEPKTGHWIVEVWNNKEHRTCSVCQRVVDYEPCYHYCPYCGAKLEEESEDKE